MSAILLFTPRNSVCLGFNIEKQFHTFQLSVIFFFFYTLGSALVKCGEAEKKIGQAGRELKDKSMTNFLHQLKTFLEGDMKTIAVSTLTLCVLHCMYFFSAWQNGRTFSFKKPLLMQSSINKSHWPHYQTVVCFIKRTVVQELPVHCMVYLSLPPLSNEI